MELMPPLDILLGTFSEPPRGWSKEAIVLWLQDPRDLICLRAGVSNSNSQKAKIKQ